MLNKYTVQLMALGLVGSLAATATADDSSALIDALVKKGVLKTKEAEQIRAQMSKDCSSKGSAGKLDLDFSCDVSFMQCMLNSALYTPHSRARLVLSHNCI